MKGFIETIDQGDYRHLININRIESVCEGDSDDNACIFVIGSDGNTLDAHESYDDIKKKIEQGQYEDDPPINTEAVGFMAEEEEEDE
ncbi:hypothetical protein OYT88_04690 [Sporolactobacillus sp. CQH2019]|uniref:hypothetical protein n=1 Tax=Sporolactobacillus sp. CQH2019 TaxID=3023512 RepID=UPI0023674B75|nr:hypothetical protein [Sporolactobacillus sp. CQH2019]MDD9147846.1 hypothetical protein [Sporolactobacillus sp. CQH2019]